MNLNVGKEVAALQRMTVRELREPSGTWRHALGHRFLP